MPQLRSLNQQLTRIS